MKKHAVIATIILAAVIALACVIYFVFLDTTKYGSISGSERRATVYTNISPYDGGTCGHVLFTEQGERTNECIAEDSVARAMSAFDISSNEKLIKIDAEVHTNLEKRTASTPSQKSEDVKVIVIDRVYSAAHIKSKD